MNKIKDEEIIQTLQNQFKHLIEIFDERQIFGIFTYGRVNYGFAESIDDIKTMVIYVPSFEEMCTKPALLTEKYLLYNNKEIKKIDARLLYELALKQDKVVMEALFSDYRIINKRYEKVFKKHIFINKEAIFHCDQKARIECAVNQGIAALDAYEQTEDREELFEAARLRIACKLYMDGAACENCISLKKDYHISYLWQILKGDLIPDLVEIRKDLLEYQEDAKNYKVNNACKELIKNGAVEIIKVAITDMTQQGDFLENLTTTEEQALDVILENLEDGYEGNVSISQLTASSGISRPVFKNVLQKMKNNLIAEIDNRGVKGTYVKIIDGIILNRI